MDPNITLHEIRELSAKIQAFDGTAYDAHMLAQKIDQLDGWMSLGQTAPDAWKETEDHR